MEATVRSSCCHRLSSDIDKMNKCTQLSQSTGYPKYCPPGILLSQSTYVSKKSNKTKKDFSQQSLIPLISHIQSRSESTSGCNVYSNCVGGLDNNCPAIDNTKCPSDDHCESFDNCVGASGIDCDGVELFDFPAVGTVNAVTPVSSGANLVRLPVSVGSIYHDLCCREYPHGAFCDSSNYVIKDTINILHEDDVNECACLPEWRKAAWNLLRGRFWYDDFSTLPHSSNLNPVGSSRPTWLPKSWGSDYIEAGPDTTYPLPEEVIATSILCAPSGTELDCPVTSDYTDCKTGGWLSRKVCSKSACDHGRHGCKSKNNKHWKSRHKTAGDAIFCCSGEFEVVYWGFPTTRYGICL